MWMYIWTTLALAMPIADLDWRVVNDTVMGGVSQSTVQVDDTLTFSGTLSLERNGGFASTRARIPRGALVGGEALLVRLRGDGRTYDLTLRRADVRLRAGSYRVAIPSDTTETEVVIPLSAFRPTSFGRPVSGAPALDSDLGQVDTLGLMLADKQPGPFSVQILEVTVLRGAAPLPASRSQATFVLRDAITTGVPLFNAGDPAGCVDVYRGALDRLLESSVLTPGESDVVREALQIAARERAGDGAWTLRYAIDSLLAGAPPTGPR